MQALTTDRLYLATRRYSTMGDHDFDVTARPDLGKRRLPAAAWLAIAERLMSEALIACLRGDEMQFVVDRVNDCYARANVAARWTPRILPAHKN